MKYSHLFIPGLLLAFNAHASNPSEEFKDASKKLWTAQMPAVPSSQLQISVSQETSDSNEESSISPRSQRIADIAEANAMAQIIEQGNKNLKKRVEEKRLQAAQIKQQKQLEKEKFEEAQQQEILEAIQKRIAVEKQKEQELLAESAALDAEIAALDAKIAVLKADKASTSQKSTTVTHTTQKPVSSEPTLDKTSQSSYQQTLSKDEIVREQQRMLDEFASQKANNNNQSVSNANSAIVVSSAGSQYNSGYGSSASFSDFEEDSDEENLSYSPAVPRFTATVIEDDNNQNVQPVIQAPVVTSIENDNVTTATNVNNDQPRQTESNAGQSRNNNFTGESILSGAMGDDYDSGKSNWVNLTHNGGGKKILKSIFGIR